jgi:hypothetical protein
MAKAVRFGSRDMAIGVMGISAFFSITAFNGISVFTGQAVFLSL